MAAYHRRHAHVVRLDPLGGRTVWTYRTRRPLQRATFGGDPVTPVVRFERGVLVTDGPAGLVLTPDGTLLSEWHPDGSPVPGKAVHYGAVGRKP